MSALISRLWSAYRGSFRIGFVLVNICFSALLVRGQIEQHSPRMAVLAAVFGLLSVVCLFPQVGWTAPCLIAGIYIGFVTEPTLGGGTAESMMWETIQRITVFAILSAWIGLALDVASKSESRKTT